MLTYQLQGPKFVDLSAQLSAFSLNPEDIWSVGFSNSAQDWPVYMDCAGFVSKVCTKIYKFSSLQASQDILTYFPLGRQLDFPGSISPLKIKISFILDLNSMLTNSSVLGL